MSNYMNKDDVETIRIHLSAIRDELYNQRRWKDAKDYNDLIIRFLKTMEVIDEQIH